MGALVRVASGDATEVTIVDRRTGNEESHFVAPFEMSTTVVTVEDWTAVAEHPARPSQAGLPVVDVSWPDAVAFCNEMSYRSGLTPAYAINMLESWNVTWDRSADGYRLPTEAEWQLACRAGTRGPHYGPLDSIAWFADNSGMRLREVAGKTPNAWGLFDMLGGIWEWCWDLYGRVDYGPYRVIRGGGWADPAWSCRAGVRRKTHPQARLDDLGFRLARSITT